VDFTRLLAAPRPSGIIWPLSHASDCDDGLRSSAVYDAWQARELRAHCIRARSHRGGMRVSQAIHGRSRKARRESSLFKENIGGTGRRLEASVPAASGRRVDTGSRERCLALGDCPTYNPIVFERVGCCANARDGAGRHGHLTSHGRRRRAQRQARTTWRVHSFRNKPMAGRRVYPNSSLWSYSTLVWSFPLSVRTQLATCISNHLPRSKIFHR
jgi:hypothetical protein